MLQQHPLVTLLAALIQQHFQQHQDSFRPGPQWSVPPGTGGGIPAFLGPPIPYNTGQTYNTGQQYPPAQDYSKNPDLPFKTRMQMASGMFSPQIGDSIFSPAHPPVNNPALRGLFG